MPDLYRYVVVEERYDVTVSSYEAKLLACLEGEGAAAGSAQATVFAAYKQGQVVRTSRAELLNKAQVLAAYLESHRELLQYRYGIETRTKTGESESSGGGGFSCLYRGLHATAEAGPGYCRLRASVKELVRYRHGGQAAEFTDTVLVDMRNMKPVTLDDGRRLLPRRRKRSIDLEEGLRGLAAFLKSHEVGEVEQSVLRR